MDNWWAIKAASNTGQRGQHPAYHSIETTLRRPLERVAPLAILALTGAAYIWGGGGPGAAILWLWSGSASGHRDVGEINRTQIRPVAKELRPGLVNKVLQPQNGDPVLLSKVVSSCPYFE
ncbi:hypothetical protein scyTo_0003576 [Scyliorhinus torazame]|uniref:Uncharacterized protein n=1 Tax=Scyliorhinus torazame TaxID=75743 RepID=A0A401PMY7_SCYTO|nr:hypothetical protein [Scyliorhinus torazame]